jgi:predicted PurR-regulated permease PerM
MDEGQVSVATQAPASQQAVPAKVARSRERWKSLWMSIVSVTPNDLAHFFLVVIGFAAVGWLIWNTWFSLLPFQIGLVLAYIILPAVNVLDKAMPRSWAIALILLAGLGVVILFFGLLIPALASEATVTAQRLPTPDQVRSIVQQLTVNTEGLPPAIQTFIRDSLDQQYASIQQNALLYAQGLFATALASLLGIFSIISFLLGFLVLPAWIMSVLGDRESGTYAVRRVVPRWMAGDFWAVIRIFDRAFGVILRGQIWRAVAIAGFTWIGASILERLGFGPFQYKLLAAMWLGIFSLVPEIGIYIGAIPILAIGLLRSPQTALLFLVLIIAVQQLESRLVTSRIESRVIDIHPAILVPALVAASQLGIFWVLVASPLLVVMRDLFRYTYGRVSDPPAPAGVLPNGESVFEAETRRERARGVAQPQLRPSGRVAPVPAGPLRPTESVQPR